MSAPDFVFGDRVRHVVAQELLVVWASEATPRGLILTRTPDGKTKRVSVSNLVRDRYNPRWGQEPTDSEES